MNKHMNMSQPRLVLGVCRMQQYQHKKYIRIRPTMRVNEEE